MKVYLLIDKWRAFNDYSIGKSGGGKWYVKKPQGRCTGPFEKMKDAKEWIARRDLNERGIASGN